MDIKKGYFLYIMCIYTLERYYDYTQGRYYDLSAPIENHIPTSLLYP